MNDLSIIIDATEDWFVELPETPDQRRTRDHRYYRNHFGVDGYRVFPRRRTLTIQELERCLLAAKFFSTVLVSHFGDGKEKCLMDYVGQIEDLNRVARKHPGVLRIGLLSELETHIYLNIPPSATPEDAYRHFRRIAFEYSAGKRVDRIAGLLGDLDHATLRKFLTAVYGVECDPAIGIYTLGDKVFGVHPHFAWGADEVHLERSGWNGNAQIAMAFLRGGAREFRGRWGFDMSAWGGSHSYGRGPTTYDLEGRHVAGISAETHWFAWMSALLAGAHAVNHQAAEVTFFRFPNPTLFGSSNCDTAHIGFPLADSFRTRDPGEWGAPLSPVGVYAERLGKLVSDPSFDRGKPVVPVALVVELWHGWESHMFPCEDWAWTGKVPVHRGDRMLSALFDMFYPGHALSGRMTDPTYNPSVPFSSEQEMMEMLYNGMDTRPLEAGIFVPTPFGDSIDVVTDGICVDVLSEYPLAILGGRLGLTPENLAKFKSYVERGGTLVVHGEGLGLYGGDVPPIYKEEIESFIGCRITQRYGLGMSPSIIVETGESFREGKYEYAVVEPVTANPMVVGDHKSRSPIVAVNQVGKGRVVFCAPHHHLTAQGKQMVAGVHAALVRLINSHVPIRIHGRPVQFCLSRLDDGWLVGLFNWLDTPWPGRVEMCGASNQLRSVKELLNRRAEEVLAPAVDGNSFHVVVPPYGVSLYRVS